MLVILFTVDCVKSVQAALDLRELLAPCWCRVKGLFAPRGGTRIHVFAEEFKEMPEEQNQRVREAVRAWRSETDPHRP